MLAEKQNGERTAERNAALVMLQEVLGTKKVTVGGDKAYDTADFVAECRNLKVTPHVAHNLERPGGSAIDARTTQHLRICRHTEEVDVSKSASDV